MATICIAPQVTQQGGDAPPVPASIPACDRCHIIKVKCVPGNTFKGCCRCFRLQHQCSYSRRRGMPGRKKMKKRRLDAYPTTSSDVIIKSCWEYKEITPASLDHGICNIVIENQVPSDDAPNQAEEVDSYSRRVRSALISTFDPRQCNSLDSDTSIQAVIWQDQLASFYAMATSFVPAMNKKLQANFSRGPPLLWNLYLALARVMRQVEIGQTELDRSDVLTCSRALQVVRDTRIHDLQSLTSYIWLGIFLTSFDRLVLGTSTHLICETMLLQLRNWYPSISTDLELMDPIVCLVFIDTITCLINRRIPLIKFKPPQPGIIDRFAGLCCDLLLMLYDACEVVAAGKLGHRFLNLSAWNDIYQRVHDWAPQCPNEMRSAFTSNELTSLLTQAHAYRLGALLILNRARRPLERQCHMQAHYSDEILSQTETCLLVVGEPPPHTIIPVFTAAMELTDREKRLRVLKVLQSCRGASYYPYMNQLSKMCSQFWSQRDAGGSPDWLTYLHRHHPLNIPV